MYFREVQVALSLVSNRISINDVFRHEVMYAISVLGQNLMAVFVCKGSLEGGEFLDRLSGFEFLEKDSVTLSSLALLVMQVTEIILHTNCIRKIPNQFSS